MVAHATLCGFPDCEAETIHPAAGRWLNDRRWLCDDHRGARRDPVTLRLFMPE